MDISAKFCPVCKNKNELDASICVHCGASLESFPADSATTKGTDLPTNGREGVGEVLFDESMIPADGIAFYAEGTARPVFSSSSKQFIIGRKVGEASDELFDLSKLGGYHLGASRRHATIRKTAVGYEVIDLGSSNGTWLNNEWLAPHKPYPLTPGSQLRLARIRLFVLYHPVTETKQKT